jgi:hypothetical protein
MDDANSVVSDLFKQEGGYLPFICKICELFGVPPEVLAIQSGTTTVSKVAELLQYLRHRSETFDDWTCVCRSEETLQSLKDYRRLLQFLQRIVTDRTFALCEEECQELQLSLSSLEGPHTDRFILAWIHSEMLSRDMIDALWIDDWKTQGSDLDQVSDKLQRKLVKIWKCIHSNILKKKDSLQELLVFLANVLPFLIKTKHFLIDEELKKSVSTNFLRLSIWINMKAIKAESTAEIVYQEMIGSRPEIFKIFPDTFEKFREIFPMTVYCWDGKFLYDVKAHQNDPNATLESLYKVFLEQRV